MIVGRGSRGAGQCRNVGYTTVGEAMLVVLRREDAAVAYRCGECDLCHVVGGRFAASLNVPRLMAEGRFIAG